MLRPTWHRVIPIQKNSRPHWRAYTEHASPPSKTKSPHAQLYSDLFPGMIPVALLGSAVYLGLQLLQGNLAHEKYLDEANARVKELEAEVAELRAGKQNDGVAFSVKSSSWLPWK